MQRKDSSDTLLSTLAVVADATAIFSGFLIATWLRFDSGLLAITIPPPPGLYHLYSLGAAAATVVMLMVFRSNALFVRPQTGSFVDKIPRLIRAAGIGTFCAAVMAFAAQNEADFARLVIGISFFTISTLVLVERYILFRIEWNLARHSRTKSNVLILGTDHVALHVTRTLKAEPMLRAQVIGFLRTTDEPANPEIPRESLLGTLDDLKTSIGSLNVHEIILTDSSISHDRIVQILLLCEQNLVSFKMVPDLFRIMTSSMDVQSLNDIPLLGISPWPLDRFWNRLMKRVEDIAGSVVGLLISMPVIALAALVIKRTSPGPVFYRQQRCGEGGRCFTLFKLRTMPMDAEAQTGPVWTVENDGRRTRVGQVLRAYNLDELPQFWNVLKGDMSLVGPRPERPHFVEQFKELIGNYMSRHVSKPGLTGWAQVNGLRGNTDLRERVKYDLYYLENWSLTFDFKILLKTFVARKNAY
jgi:exopolysaccharide biosynthesis polyprenyl glycosylphosphotransferase